MKKIIASLLLIPVMAMATITAEQEFALNRLSGVARKYSLGSLVHQTKNVMVGKYDFSKQGGAVGNVNLWKDLNGGNVTSNYTTIPDNAVIQNVWLDVLTQPVGTTMSIKIELVNDADLFAATSAASFTALHQGIPDLATIGDWIKLSADKVLKAEFVTNPLTAGKFNVYVEYILGD